MAKIIEMEIGHRGFLQSEIQTSADIARIQPYLCFARKHQLRFHRRASILLLQQFKRCLIERDGASFAISVIACSAGQRRRGGSASPTRSASCATRRNGRGEAFISLTLIMSAVRIVLPSRLFERIPLDQLPLLTEAECMSSDSVNQSNLFE